MSVLYLVVPLAFVFAGGAVAAFIWAVRGDQFEDLETPAMRALFDDAPRPSRRLNPRDGEHSRRHRH